MMARAFAVFGVLTLLVLLPVGGPASATETRIVHGLSLFGDLKYPPEFQHFDYVNPDAPKGGEVRLSMTGGFDNFNPFIPKGRTLGAIQLFAFDTLTKSALDEPASEYGLIAKSMEVAADYSFVIFTLRPEARFQDGAPKRVLPPRHPAMHRTRTVDYAIVMSGEIDMLLDDSEIHLKAGDVLVQQGTNHAWVNRGKEPCRIAFILVDAKEP